MYIVIRTGADGISIDQMPKDLLEKQLEERYWGRVTCATELPKNSDSETWDESLIIIKGEVVVPEAVQTVTKYRVP